MNNPLPNHFFSAVLFDMDGVIVDSIPTHVRAWCTAFRAHGVELDPNLPRMREGEKALQTCVLLSKHYNLGWSLPQCESLVAEKRKFFRSQPSPQVFPEFTDCLKELNSRGIPIAVVTGSARANVQHVLSKTLLKSLDALVCAEDVQQGKPNPEPYLKAVSALGLAVGDCLVVENAPLGIQSARAANIAVLALTTTLAKEHLRDANEIHESHKRVLDLVRH